MLMKYIYCLLFIIIIIVFAGCNDINIDEGNSFTNKTKPYKAVFIPKNTGNPYMDVCNAGFEKAANELGMDYSYIGPSTTDATSQLPIIKAQIQRGVDIIAIYLNSNDALAPILIEARSKGILVFCLGSDTTIIDSRDVGFVPANRRDVGVGFIEILGRLMNYEGEWAILSATTDAPDQNEWNRYTLEEFNNNAKYKNMTYMETVYGNDDPQKSTIEMEALITKYPKLKGVISPTTVGIAGAAQAIETTKKADQIKLTGIGLPNLQRRFIKNNTMEEFGLWFPDHMGYSILYLADQVLNGKISEIKEGVKFNAGELGEKTILKNRSVDTDPFTIFNKDNIDKWDF